MAQNIQYGLRWSVEVVAVPQGAGPMSVPDQQRLKLSQAATNGGGMITVGSTGNFPLAANFVTACNTLATNAAAAINTPVALAQIQGWNSGGG